MLSKVRGTRSNLNTVVKGPWPLLTTGSGCPPCMKVNISIFPARTKKSFLCWDDSVALFFKFKIITDWLCCWEQIAERGKRYRKSQEWILQLQTISKRKLNLGPDTAAFHNTISTVYPLYRLWKLPIQCLSVLTIIGDAHPRWRIEE